MMNIQSTGMNGLRNAEDRLRSTVLAERERHDAAQAKSAEAAGKPQEALQNAGKAFVRENPVPDARQGVVMTLSAQGKEMSAKNAQQTRQKEAGTQQAQQMNPAQEVQKAEESAESAKEDKTEVVKKTQPEAPKTPTPREAIEEVRARMEGKTEDGPGKEVAAGEKDKDGSTGQVNTANLSGYNKNELKDFFLNGSISLKAYKEELDSRMPQARDAAMVELATAS